MNPPCFLNLAQARVVSSNLWHRLAAVASVVCLWTFTAGAAPPANDDRANATAIAGQAGRLATASNVDATKEVGEPNHVGNTGGKSIWFRWTAAAAGSVRFDTVGTTFDTVMGVYVTNASGLLVLVAENDDAAINYFRFSGGYHQSRAVVTAVAGTTYFVAVDGFDAGAGAPSGPVVFNWNQIVGTTAPANNDFASATVITGTEGGFSGRTHNSNKQGGEPNHGDATNPGGRSVWYRWTAPISGDATIDTYGSSHIDTLLGVYTGNVLAGLTSVAQSDDINAFVPFSHVTFPAVAGTTYQIAVDGFNGGSGAAVGSVALHYKVSATPPSNNNFADAQTLVGTKGQANGATHAATIEAGEPLKAGSAGGRSVWFNWTPDANGQVTFDTMGIHFDSILAAYTGDDVAGLTPVSASDDVLAFQGVGVVSSVSRMSFMATAGTTYRIAVDGYSEAGVPADYSSFSLNWEQAVNAPSNDLFSAATVLQGNRGTITTSNSNAVFEDGEPIHSVLIIPPNIFIGGMCGKSLWFKWTVAHSRPVTIETAGSSFDTQLAVYTGNDFASLVLVTNHDNLSVTVPIDLTSRVDFNAVEGTTYFIVVDGQNDGAGRGAASGTVVLHYDQPGGPPDNDNFADAFALTGMSGSTNGFSFDATTEPGEPDRGADEPKSSSWYHWTAPASGWFTFDTLGSEIDTTLGIYTGTEFGNFAEVGSNNNIDDSIPIFQSRVTFLATGGITYQVAVDGTFDAQGDFVLNWAPTAILSIEIVAGSLQLTLKVADGDMYKIQDSTNLTSWNDVQTVSAGGGPATIDLGPIAGIPKKFYRAIQAP